MNKPTLKQIENAFVPAKEITDSDRFAGRKDAVSDAFYALLAEVSMANRIEPVSAIKIEPLFQGKISY